MKKDSILEKKYLERVSEDITKLSKEKIFEILKQGDELYPTEFLTMLSRVLYSGIYAKYSNSTQEKSKKLYREIDILKDCLDRTEKEMIYKEIVNEIQEQLSIDTYDTYKLPEALEDLIRYGFEIEDVESCVMLMKKRKEILDYMCGCDLKTIPGYYDRLDTRKQYKKFIKMVVDHCDEATAEKYVDELAEGNYMKLDHSTEHGYWDISKKDIMDTYKFYQLSKVMSLSDMEILLK